MMQHGGGQSSTFLHAGLFVVNRPPAYAASKAGLDAMGQSIAKALGEHKIYITTVAPGWVETDMAAAYLATGWRLIRRSESAGAKATPDEVACTVLFASGAEF
jgi:NAD(P)-dependent dehydrogenase (short-subunit alcohol dehydrogenase family)